MKHHLLQVTSLFKSSLGSMIGRAPQPWKDVCPLFITDPSIIDLGLNFDGNISTASAGRRRVITPNHLSKPWRIGIEAAKKYQKLQHSWEIKKSMVLFPGFFLLMIECYNTNELINTSSQTHSLSQRKRSLLVVILVCNYLYQIKDLCL